MAKLGSRPWSTLAFCVAVASGSACENASDAGESAGVDSKSAALAQAPQIPSGQNSWATGTHDSNPKDNGLKAAPGRLIVKFKSSGSTAVTECARTLLKRGRSFATATADGSASLDLLVKRHQVRDAQPLVPAREGVDTATAQSRLKRRLQAHAARSQRVAPASAKADPVNVYRLTIPVSANVAAVAAEFARDPHVEYAQPDHVLYANYTPDDPYLASSGSWGQAEADLWAIHQIEAESAWQSARGAGVVVAVVDTGLDMSHPDIASNVWNNPDEIPGNGVDDDGNGLIDDVNGWDFNSDDADPTDDHGHGTHVAGTIAADDNNAMGVVGVAPDARIMPVKALDSGGAGTEFDLAEALVYAAQSGADVINNSWGCRAKCPSMPVVEEAVSTAYLAGSVVVFAAGNSADDIRDYAPENRFEPIVVSASDPTGAAASFSNFGVLDVAAPGAGNPGATGVSQPERGILSLKSAVCDFSMCPPELIVGDAYLRQAGTSMAAPHVSGLAALILSQHPDYSQEQVRQVLHRSSANDGGFTTSFGYGRIRAAAALAEPTPLEALIEAPARIEAPAQYVVGGIAKGEGFASYTLDYGAGSLPTTWSTIATSQSPMDGGGLGLWNVNQVTDGDYTLRVTARTQDGRQYEDRQLVTLDRVALTSPEPMSVKGSGAFQILGTANPANLDHFAFRVERLADGSPLADPGISLSGGGRVPVQSGVLATWDPARVPADHYRLILDVMLQNGDVVSESVILIVDPRVHPGWPVDVPAGNETQSRLTFQLPINEHSVLADVDRDGRDEVIIAYVQQVSVLKHDGTQLTGWPQSVSPSGESITILWESPVVGDIDGDGSPEIAVASYNGRIWVWNADGTLQAGWPRAWASSTHDLTLADVDRNGRLDIVATDSEAGINVFRADGTSLPGFPVATGAGLSGAVTVADINRDGRMELVGLLSGRGPATLVAYTCKGQPLPGFPQVVNGASSAGSYPVVGDLDDDGDLEIVATAASSSDVEAATVTAYHHGGQLVSGWPRSTAAFEAGPPVLADLDGDGSLEVIAGFGEVPGRSALYVWDAAGNVRPGWPVYTPSSILFTIYPFLPPVVLDVDNDGRSELIGGRLQDFYLPELETPYGYPIQAFRHDATPIPTLIRPTFGSLRAKDNSPAVGDTDGDGLLELVWLEDQTLSSDRVLAHTWDLDVPVSAKRSWTMFRGDARHSGVAERVVPIVTLTPADRDLPRTINGLARFRITTGAAGVIQLAHPWSQNVQYAVGSNPLQKTPNGWGGPIQLQPNTQYVLRVVTPSSMQVRISWW